jgi:hypothetical protein
MQKVKGGIMKKMLTYVLTIAMMIGLTVTAGYAVVAASNSA